MEYFLGFCTIVGGLSALWFFWDRIYPQSGTDKLKVGTRNSSEQELNEFAKNMIKEYYSDKKQIHTGVSCCDLSNVGVKNEIVVHSNNDRNEFVDVFSLKNREPENIFHCKAETDEEVKTFIHSFNNVNYFLFTKRAGSGGFLDIFIYSYDNISKLSLCFQKKDLYHGSIFFIPNKILLSGNSAKYELIQKDSKFLLKKYNKQLISKIKDDSKILSFTLRNKNFKILLDKKNVHFTKTNGQFISKKKYNINMDEQIIVDDNFTNYDSSAFKILIDGLHFSFNQGFYYTIKPISIGIAKLSIQLNSEWYIIEFAIN